MTSGATARINEERVLEQQKVSENTVGHLHVDSQTTRFKGKSLNILFHILLFWTSSASQTATINKENHTLFVFIASLPTLDAK
jgi:hypothetical protein